MRAGTIRGVGQVAVTVQDVDRARDFYRDVVGLRHLFDASPSMSFFDCGVRLLLGRAEPGATHGSSIVYFDTDDIQAAYDTLAARGATFDASPHKVADLGDAELWLAFFRDSEENVMALMSEVPKAET